MSFYRVEVYVFINRSLNPRPGVVVSRLEALKRDTEIERITSEVDSNRREYDIDYKIIDMLTSKIPCPVKRSFGSRDFVATVGGKVILDSHYKPKKITRAIKQNG